MEEVDLWIAVIQQAIEDALYDGNSHGRNCNPSHADVARAKAFLRNEDGAFGDICRALGVDRFEIQEKISTVSRKCMAKNPHIGL